MSTAIRLRAWQFGVQIPAEEEIYRFSKRCRELLGHTLPPIQWIPWVISSLNKRLWREPGHWPPPTGEDKNEWMNAFTPLIRLHAVYCGNFYFIVMLSPPTVLQTLSFARFPAWYSDSITSHTLNGTSLAMCVYVACDERFSHACGQRDNVCVRACACVLAIVWCINLNWSLASCR